MYRDFAALMPSSTLRGSELEWTLVSYAIFLIVPSRAAFNRSNYFLLLFFPFLHPPFFHWTGPFNLDIWKRKGKVFWRRKKQRGLIGIFGSFSLLQTLELAFALLRSGCRMREREREREKKEGTRHIIHTKKTQF